MKKISILLLITTLFVLTGCVSLHSGMPTNSAQLNQGNFKYIKQNVSGYSMATYFIGIGGNRRFAMIAEAKSDLLEQFPLQQNQALVNVTVDFKTTSFLGLLLNLVYCTYSADVVEFEPLYVNNNSLQKENMHQANKTQNDTRIDNDLFVFENPTTKERYYIHPSIKSGNSYTMTFTEIKSEVEKKFKNDGYFLPYIEEFELLYKNIKNLPFIPKVVYWSAESQDGKIKCFDLLYGEIVLLNPSEKAALLPMFINK
jgi:hypothetical protein